MASIVENIVGDKALQLGNEEFVRPLNFANSWNYIRIIARITLNGSATVLAPRLQFGVCDGWTNTFAAPSSVNYVGGCPVGIGQSGGGAFVWDGTNYRYSGPGTPSIGFVKKIGSTITETQGGDNGIYYYVASSTGGSQPSLLAVDVVRVSSSSYSVGAKTITSAMLALKPRWYDLLRTAEDQDLTSYGATYLKDQTRSTLTGLSSNMDTLSIYWNYSTPTVEISDLCVIRFY